ncbi:hypothetical protein STEG23_031497 [Scotinomys teguina]
MGNKLERGKERERMECELDDGHTFVSDSEDVCELHASCAQCLSLEAEANFPGTSDFESRFRLWETVGLCPAYIGANGNFVAVFFLPSKEMIESDIPPKMSGMIRSSGLSHHRSPQEYRPPGSPETWVLPALAGDSSRAQENRGALTGAADLSVGTTTHPLLRGQAAMAPRGMLGLGPMGSHRASAEQMNQFPIGSQSSSGLQEVPQLYSAAAQLQFPLPPGSQQCPPAGLYGSPFAARPSYPQGHMTVHSSQELHPKHYPKPIYSYSCLIAMALKNSKTGSLPVSEIYSFMKEHFPYFKTAPDGWKNSVRHNLSLNKCFEKVETKSSGSSRKGCLWALNLARIDKMEEEMYKWKRKDLAAIHRSMANPEELDKLISDRPESCRRPSKPGEPEAPVLTHATTVAMAHSCLATSQLPPKPLMTLSLQSIPLHHQVQPQTHLDPDSPASAQTPPLHTLPHLSPGPLPQSAMGRPPGDFLTINTEMTTEVDALDPSIMDFALQGDLWEEMKGDSLSLETLGAFTDSPLGCDLGPPSLTPVSGSSDQSFPDVQVTSLYAAYSTPDNVAPAVAPSAQYLGTPGNAPNQITRAAALLLVVYQDLVEDATWRGQAGTDLEVSSILASLVVEKSSYRMSHPDPYAVGPAGRGKVFVSKSRVLPAQSQVTGPKLLAPTMVSRHKDTATECKPTCKCVEIRQ